MFDLLHNCCSLSALSLFMGLPVCLGDAFVSALSFCLVLEVLKRFSSGFIGVCQLPVCTSQALSVGYTSVYSAHCMMHFSSPVSLVV
jgi:hypothetical protein